MPKGARTSLAVPGEPAKSCSTCGPRRGPLALTSFWRCSRNSDGLQNKCIDCFLEYESKNREKRREYRNRNKFKTMTLEKKGEGKEYRPGVGAKSGYRSRIAEWVAGGDPYGVDAVSARIRAEHWLKEGS